MPHIKEIAVHTPQDTIAHSNFDVGVKADIEFTRLERELGLSYKARIALYEIDGQMDVYSVQPNWQQLFLQRAARGNKDDFLGFSPAFDLTASDSEKTISHTFDVRSSLEPDSRMEIRALVVCVPETAVAMKWSGETRVSVVIG